MMGWHELDDHSLPSGVVAVDTKGGRVTLGVKTVKTWRLDRFHSVTPLINNAPGLLAFQLHTDDQGKRTLLSGSSGTLAVACQTYLRQAGAKRGRYLAKLEKGGLIVIDFTTALPQGWLPQKERYQK